VAIALKVGAMSPVHGADLGLGTNVEPVRIAFTSRMFTDVNRNDVQAAVKAWAQALAEEHHLPMNAEPIILSGLPDLRKALLAGSIDAVTATTEEYLGLEPELRGTNLFMSSVAGRFTEEYLLLVRTDSGFGDLRALHGRNLILFDSARASLAPLWLDLVLSKQGLGAAAEYFGRIQKAAKPANVVLPVFFRKQDACIVTRSSFDTMCELNPQVRSQLSILGTSPELVPALCFLRRTYNSPLREQLKSAWRGLDKSPAGTQLLTLFHCDRLSEVAPALLSTARELVEAHQRLKLAPDVSSPQNNPPSLSTDEPHQP
jgi:phosphonate transport system substrate-binding protein